MKTKTKKIMAAWIAAVLAAGGSACANGDHSAQSASFTSSQKTRTIDDLFPEEMDPDAYSQGIVNLSSLWKASEDIPVYASDENRQPGDQIGTIPAGETFRIRTLATYPMSNPDTPIIYGSLADGSGWTELYNHDLEQPIRANLEGDYVWSPDIPASVDEATKMYTNPDGKEETEGIRSSWIVNLVNAEDGTVWAQTKDAYYPLYTEEGPSFFSPIFGYARGYYYREESISSLYAYLLMSSMFENWQGGLNWGIALADFNQDGRMELLVESGGLNKDQRVTVYGATQEVIDHQTNGTFSNACSILYQDSNGSVLRFQNFATDKNITRLEIENGQLVEKKLTDEEEYALDSDSLSKLELSIIFNHDIFKSIEMITLQDWYPDYPYKPQPQSPQNWILNYDMVLRSAPNRESEQIGLRRQGEVVQIINSQSNDGETWGQTSDGGWICLQDPEYQYATMQ